MQVSEMMPAFLSIGCMEEPDYEEKQKLFIFITPGFVVYTIFAIIPILYVVYLAFTNYTGMGKADFVGFENFIRIFNDERFTPAFFNSLKNNLKYLLCVWFIITPFQYFLAYFFFIKIPAYKYIKFMVFLPYVISSTVIGFFATLLFNPNIGLMNTILKSLGMAQSAWFGNPSIAFKLLVLVIMWQGAGSGIMIFYAISWYSQEIMVAAGGWLYGVAAFYQNPSAAVPSLLAPPSL